MSIPNNLIEEKIIDNICRINRRSPRLSDEYIIKLFKEIYKRRNKMDKIYLIKNRYDDTIFFTLSNKQKADKLLEFLGSDYYIEHLILDEDIDVYNLKKYYYMEIILANGIFYNRYEKNNLFDNEERLLKDIEVTFVKDKLTKITMPISKEKYETFGYKEKMKYDEIIRDIINLKDEKEIKERIGKI